MLTKLSWLSFAFFLSFISTVNKTLAHGAIINYEKVDAIALIAQYDTGQPMSNAQVVVYAPDNPSEPYLQGVADEKGNFTFTPDKSITGNWTVRVRTAGHGSIINIPIEPVTQTTVIDSDMENETKSSTKESQIKINPNNSSMQSFPNNSQKLLMAVSGVWGFVGTALFFSRPKKRLEE